MSGLKTVSRSQLYDSSAEEGISSDDQEYNYPPPGFDFEIVDVEDAEEESQQKEDTDSNNAQVEEKEEKVEFFPLFSTTAGADSSASADGTTGNTVALVKIKVDDLADVDDDNGKEAGKVNDEEWDQIAKERNASRRPLSFYYPAAGADAGENFTEYKSVAVDGDTVIRWSKQFRILTDYKVTDLDKFNATVDIYHKIERSAKNGRSRKRPGKKQRDAKIFKKERLRVWKENLRAAKERAKQRTYREHSDANAPSTKTKFGDSFRKRSNTVSRNIGRPGKPVFRTE